MARIFLCHASEDKPQVREVYNRLRTIDGFEPWLDELDILPGQDWNYEIGQALEHSDFVIVFLSTRSVQKIGYVQREFKHALQRSEEMPEGFIHTVPVKLDDCAPPHQFHRQQWVKLYEKGAFDRIVAAIRRGLQQRNLQMPQPNVQRQTTYDEQEILDLIPYYLSHPLNDRKRERRPETFPFVQDNHNIYKYTRREIDNMAPSQREKLFAAAPEMKDWWRGKSLENGTWPLFRFKGGTWVSKERMGQVYEQMSQEQRSAIWEIPGLNDWYVDGLVF